MSSSSLIAPKIEKFITADGTVRVSSVIATKVVEEARQIHDSYPVASAALGRALIGSGLLASFMKDEGRLALHFKGDGPLGAVFAEGSTNGSVRGFIVNPHTHVPSKNGKLNVGGAVGRGILSVATSLPNEKQPYTGSVQIQSGEIGEDIAYYLFQSQQTPSIVALGVFVEPDNTVSAAGGSILQVMPGAGDKILQILEERVKQIRPVTEMILGGCTTSDLAFELLEDLSFRRVDGTPRSSLVDDSIQLAYRCHCDSKRVERSLLLMGAEELGSMVDLAKPAEVRCDFCGRKYEVLLETLRDLLNLAKG